jgi:hypothetical protein
MKIRMNKILMGHSDQAFEAAGLRRNSVHATQDTVLAETLAELEATGDAMRFVDGKGQIAWKATPRLRNYLMDLQLDAQEDLDQV